MNKKCPECGSRHLVSIRGYEIITEYQDGIEIFKGSQVAELYPMWGCINCGWGTNTLGNNINVKGALEVIKYKYGEGRLND